MSCGAGVNFLKKAAMCVRNDVHTPFIQVCLSLGRAFHGVQVIRYSKIKDTKRRKGEKIDPTSQLNRSQFFSINNLDTQYEFVHLLRISNAKTSSKTRNNFINKCLTFQQCFGPTFPFSFVC